MKIQNILRGLTHIISISIVLTVVSLADDLPGRAWRYPGYDLRGSFVYPFPSGKIENPVLRIESRPLWTSAGSNHILAGDVNGDGSMEICISSLHVIEINDSELNRLREFYVASPNNRLMFLGDIDNDSVLDIGTAFSFFGETDIVVYDYGGKELLRIQRKTPGRSGYKTAFITERGDLISTINCGYDRYPRGVISYNFISGERNWFYHTGCPIIPSDVEPLSAADIDNDNIIEILLSSASPENGAVGFGLARQGGDSSSGTPTYDNCAYTIVIDENGEELYTIRESSKSNTALISSFFRPFVDSSFAMMCYNGTGDIHRPLTASKLFIRDAVTGRLIKTFYGKFRYNMKCMACDIDTDGASEIIVSNYKIDKTGYYSLNYILDNNLNIVEFSREIPGIIICANDLNGDGKMEMVFQDHDELFVVDDDLDIILRYKFPRTIYSNTIIVDADSDGYNEIYLATDKMLYKIEVGDGEK
jgi:hypothetical protein